MRAAIPLFVIAVVALSRATSAEDWIERRVAATELLQEERWEEAAALVDPHPHSLEEAVHWAWNHATTADWDAVRRDRVRYGLMAFYVRYGSLANDYGRSSGRIVEWGPEYVAIVARLPESERPSPPLDFSHLELLQSVAPLSHAVLSDANFAAALAAAREDHESIPAIAACLHCLRRQATENNRDRQADDQRALADALTGDLGRLTLARHAAVGNHYGDRGFAIRMLEDGWRLAPTAAQRAGLLYALAESHEAMFLSGMGSKEQAAADLRSALATATEVYQSFHETPAAARARASAVRWITQVDDVEAGLALVRQLQQAGEAQRSGLAEALNTLASVHLEAKEFDQAEPLLREIVRDYPDEAAALRAMLALAMIVGERGNDDQELHWLKRCVDFARSDPNSRSYVDVESTRFSAIQLLAEWHERHQHWRQAMERWESWRPGEWCATCGMGSAGMEKQRREHMAKCHAQLGNHALAAAICVQGLANTLADTKSTATILHRLYTEADQLDDLCEMLDAMDARQLDEWARNRSLRHLTDEERGEYLISRPVRTLLAGRPLVYHDGSPFKVPEWNAFPADSGSLPKTLDEVERLEPTEK